MKRENHASQIEKAWSRNAGAEIPVYARLAGVLKDAILNGIYPPGRKLPSYRFLASLLGISKNSVSSAFLVLEKEGYVLIRPKSGAFVRNDLPRKNTLNWEAFMGGEAFVAPPAAIHFHRRRLGMNREAINLSNRMDETWDDFSGLDFIRPHLDRAMASLRSRRYRDLYDEQGMPGLRELLSGHLGEAYGISASPREIIVLSRRMQAYNFLSQVFLSPNIRVAYPKVSFLNFYWVGISRIAQKVRLEVDGEGPVVDVLRRVRGRKMLFIQPTHAEPTGLVTSAARRREILDLSHDEGMPVVEDAVMDPLSLEADPLPPLKSMAGSGSVIYIGGVHGPVTPGLSLDWIVAPEAVIEKLLSEARREAQFPSELNQLLVAELIREGLFLPLLRQEKEILRSRYEDYFAILDKHLGDIAVWERRQSWGRIWIRFDPRVKVSTIYRHRRDVDFLPGSLYGDESDSTILLYVFCHRDVFEEGLLRLRRLIGRHFGI